MFKLFGLTASRGLLKRIYTASMINLMVSVGFLFCLASLISPGLMESAAASAFLRKGMATYKSRSAASFSIAIEFF